jgi:D-threo-aldose 1-dehydrogenase
MTPASGQDRHGGPVEPATAAAGVRTRPLHWRTVGHTDLQVTRLGLGTVPLGGKYQPMSDAQAIATVHAALAQGISWFDTAPRYGFGRAEQRLGTALAGVPRERYVVATKVGWHVEGDGTRVPAFTRVGVQRSLERSLERLGIDRVDIVHIHGPDDYYREVLGEVFPLLAEWRAQGVVRAISAGMNQWEMLADFTREADFDCFLLAGRYTLLEQGALESFLPLCVRRKISIFLGGVYNSGILATGARPGTRYNYAPAPLEVLERVRQMRRSARVTLYRSMLRRCSSHWRIPP